MREALVEGEFMIGTIETIKLKDLGVNVNIYSYLILKGTYILLLSYRDSVKRSMKRTRPSEGAGAEEGDVKVKSEELKLQLIKEVSKSSEDVLANVAIQISELLKETREALKANGYMVKECVIKSAGRALVGAGGPVGKIPFEVGLSLDPLLGVPYVPGSTLKGAFRHALIELSRTGIGDCDEKLADDMFGSQDHSGLVGVTDAYPLFEEQEVRRVLEPDVISPHYPGAEDEQEAKPVPVQFLTIAPGVKLKFFTYYKGEAARHIFRGDLEAIARRYNKPQELMGILKCIDKAVLYALIRGVGAKTSTGYSRFELIDYRDV